MPKKTLVLFIGAMLIPSTLLGTDVDGPYNGKDFYDRGDAPNGIPAYPDGTVGRFPQVSHFNQYDFDNVWLGWYPTNSKEQGPLYGEDDDFQFPLPHCRESAFGMTFDQDECIQDSTDMCLRSPIVLTPCESATFKIAYIVDVTCGLYLNVLVDFNGDGDWGDVSYCEATQDSVSEWAVKNYQLPEYSFPPWTLTDVPPFLVGPRTGPTWMRISLSSESMPDTYPTNGTQQRIHGGETEDYPFVIGGVVPTRRLTWGTLKSRFGAP